VNVYPNDRRGVEIGEGREARRLLVPQEPSGFRQEAYPHQAGYKRPRKKKPDARRLLLEKNYVGLGCDAVGTLTLFNGVINVAKEEARRKILEWR